MKPTIILGCSSGYHNEHFEELQERLKNAKQYKNCSTVILTATRGMIPAQVVTSWLFLMGPANAQIGRLFCQGMEVASAYNSGITTILGDPNMEKTKYVLTLEEDNAPPHDGLIKMYENICDCDVPCKEHFVALGGLYFMKGEMGQPMLFGDPDKNEDFIDFTPQVPKKDTIQECNGVGMGFTLFHKGLFQLDEIPKPWFETEQTVHDEKTVKAYTQDLYFMERLREAGYRVACDTSVKVGHFDAETGMMW